MDIKAKTVLVYLGSIDARYPPDDQLKQCRKAVKELGLPGIGRGVYQPDELSELVRHLRGNELVMLPKLSMLAENRSRGIGSRLLTNIIRVATRAEAIVDIHAGISSYDYLEWFEHIDTTRNRITNGRPMSSAEAKKRAALQNPRGLEKHWTEHVKVVEPERFKQLQQHWLDPRMTAAQAIEQSPDDELKRAHRSMWERIFGGKTTGKPVR